MAMQDNILPTNPYFKPLTLKKKEKRKSFKLFRKRQIISLICGFEGTLKSAAMLLSVVYPYVEHRHIITYIQGVFILIK